MQSTPQSFDAVLSSMCTEPHPAARQAAIDFLATNPGDPGTFPAVADLERRALAHLGEVVGLTDPHGYIASGGTEANIQAVHAARNLAETTSPNLVIPASAHFSFEKAAAILDVEVRIADLDGDRRVDPASVASLIDDDTVLVVGVAGTTEYGRVDPIPTLVDIAETVDARVHVDTAWGGFAVPFTDYDWNFTHVDIDTLTIDPHKLGQAAIPAGGFLARDPSTLEAIAVETPYLHTDAQATLLGTRSGAGVASTAAALDALWPDGYRAEFDRAMDLAAWFADALRERGVSVVEPTLPIVASSINDAVFHALRERGWRISRTATGEVRVVVMPHVRREQLEVFLGTYDELRRVAVD